MRWDLVAILGVVLGFLLIVKGFDTLTTWRAWFFGIWGLVFFVPGILRVFFRIRGLRSRKETIQTDK